jgi:hypothetical protein
MRVLHLDRDEFLSDYWSYQPGEHLGLIGPTQRAGKTTFGFQLLEHTDRKLPAAVLVMKPRDHVVASNTQRLGYREVDNWPPPWNPFKTNNRNVVWPKHTFNPDRDNDHMHNVFRKAMLDNYERGNNITFADEIYGLSVELGLYTEAEALLTRGGGMGAGIWYGTQKPSGTRKGTISSFCFNSPTHMFLSRDPDKRNRERYGELEVGDPHDIEDVTQHLRPFEFLYINRIGPTFAVVGA